MNYTNREVVRRLKQYDMFLNSLSLTKDKDQRERICDQLDKIEKQILLETNTEYESEYMRLLEEETSYFSEEKARLKDLISLILERKNYLEERKERHQKVTGSIVELTTFQGEDKLSEFRRRIQIIEKYEQNKVRGESLIKDMKELDVKISSASRNVKSNNRLNEILENKMISLVGNALDKFDLYSLTNERSAISKKYDDLEYALKMAKDNLKSAREVGDETLILECDEMLSKIATEYSKYHEKINILNLIDIYDKPVSSYDELLRKREKIDAILRNITDTKLYRAINDEISKQYNTIKLEKQDIASYEELKNEREIKNKKLYEIEEENNSTEFKSVIEELAKNENRLREEKIRKARREEFQERQKKILEEQKIEASRVRRQKLIEEARLKEQQERAKKVKELQEHTVLTPKREESVPKKEELLSKIREFPKTEESVKNLPPKRTFDEIITSNNFDTDELFENTKIVPNKITEVNHFDELPLWDVEKPQEHEKLDAPPFANSKEIDTETFTEMPLNASSNLKAGEMPAPESTKSEIDTTSELEGSETKDLFKKENNQSDLSFKDTNSKEDSSIYDILENNKNIIWKTTDTKVNKEAIPVINNNNLKPEILENRKVDTLSFPNIENKKEGEIIWKETQ